MRTTVICRLRAGLFLAVMIAGVWMPGRALGVDKVVSQPAVGYSFPPDGTPEATKARIVRVGNLAEANFPLDEKFHVPIDCELEFQAERASGDWDTRRHGDECNVVEDPVADTLHEDWPRWKCEIGGFVGPDKGTTVKWKAPPSETAQPGVEMQVYEDDDGTKTPGVPDIGITGYLGKYGIKQDKVTVKAVALAVTLTIRNQNSQETTNTTPNGPDSRGQLGLWNAHPANKNDMRWRCANHTTGDVYNGSVVYQGEHPWKIGTGLKAEMYAAIDETPITNAFLLTHVNMQENWRIKQQRIEKRYLNGVEDTGWPFRPPEWHDDAYIAHNTPNGAYPDDQNGNTDYLYGEDCPMKRGENGMYDTGTVLRWVTEFRTWVEFCYLGSWVRVTPVPEPEGSGDWAEGKPMWGLTWELTWGTSGLSVTGPATLIEY